MCAADDVIRLRHMAEYPSIALAFAQEKDRKALEANLEFQFAILRAIELIGEAASKIEPSCKDKYAQIPWKAITGMRNILIHAYFDIESIKSGVPFSMICPFLMPNFKRF